MQPGDLTAVKTLLLHALQQPAENREEFIDKHPNSTWEQKQETLALLRARSSPPSILNESLLTLMPSKTRHQEQDLLLSGDVVAGRYLVQALLSRTNSSQVFLAADLRLAGNLVAVKLLPIETERFQEMQDQLWREIESLARLRHHAVSGLIDTGIHNGHPFLVTQYYPGPTLDQWVNTTEPSRTIRLRVFLRLLSAVEAIHRAGLLHLDLKPENIIVSNEPADQPEITILDFGISSLVTEANTHRAGTPNYSAPERALGIATSASDVYSLGQIGGWLLPEVESSVQNIIQRATAADLKLRPQTAAEFLSSLEAALKQEASSSWRLKRLVPAAILSLALLAAIPWSWNTTPAEAPRLKEITSLRGSEMEPSISPDGATVYFGHETKPVTNTAIYEAPYGGGEPKLLFTPPPESRFHFPVASPDGKHLAFIEDDKEGRQHIIYADLESRRMERVFSGHPHTISFGPSPSLLYFSDRTASFPGGQVMLFEFETRKVEPLPAPPSGHFADLYVAISPNGKYAVYSRFRTPECADLYLVELNADGRSAATPVKITSIDKRVQRPQWLPDNRTIVFSAGSLTSFSLWKATLATNPTAPATIEQLPEWGALLRTPFAASNSNRMVFVSDREDCDIYRLKLDGTGQLERYLSSTRLDEEPRYSPDGQSVAFLSERSGSLQGWIAERDRPAAPRRITSFELGEKAWPAWTPSGSAIFFARLPKLGPEMVQLDPPFGKGEPRRIFTASHAQRIAGISADATAVFAEITPPDQPQLQRWSLITEGRESIAPIEARFVREFFRNGKSGERILFYTERRAYKGLFLLENGKPRRVYPSLVFRNTFTYRDGFAYLVSDEPEPGIYKVDIVTGKPSLLLKLDRNSGWGMDISPDGKELLIALYDFDDSNIVGVEWPKAPNNTVHFFERLFSRR